MEVIPPLPLALKHDWLHVRHLPPGDTWHPATDHLVGTAVYGDKTDDSKPWSIHFGGIDFKRFLFKTGDGKVWLIAPKEAVYGEFGIYTPRDIERSSYKSLPY